MSGIEIRQGFGGAYTDFTGSPTAFAPHSTQNWHADETLPAYACLSPSELAKTSLYTSSSWYILTSLFPEIVLNLWSEYNHRSGPSTELQPDLGCARARVCVCVCAVNFNDMQSVDFPLS